MRLVNWRTVARVIRTKSNCGISKWPTSTCSHRSRGEHHAPRAPPPTKTEPSGASMRVYSARARGLAVRDRCAQTACRALPGVRSTVLGRGAWACWRGAFLPPDRRGLRSGPTRQGHANYTLKNYARKNPGIGIFSLQETKWWALAVANLCLKLG